MTTNQPWMKFYPADWRSDPRLRMCSLAARGLWMEMLALMHEAQPYGHLMIAGRHPTDTQLSALVGAPPDQIPDLVRELEAAGVFSRTREKVIFSRRMVADDKKARISRKNGKSGGNPNLRKQKEIQPWDNPQDKGGDKTQKPEARYQNKEDGGDPRSPAHEGPATPPPHKPAPATDHIPIWKSVLTVMGVLDDPKWAGSGHMCAAWVRQGISAETIISTVTATMERLRRSGQGPPNSLKYFDPAIARAHADANRPMPEISDHAGQSPPTSRTGAKQYGSGYTQDDIRSAIVAGLAGELGSGGSAPLKN